MTTCTEGYRRAIAEAQRDETPPPPFAVYVRWTLEREKTRHARPIKDAPMTR
jgi:hypothetical protein